jgi:hypothetical protein
MHKSDARVDLLLLRERKRSCTEFISDMYEFVFHLCPCHDVRSPKIRRTLLAGPVWSTQRESDHIVMCFT